MKKLSVIILTIVLTGCSTIASEQKLAKNNQWMQVGKMDGVAGYHQKSVPELEKLSTINENDLALYQSGYREGIEEYCQPKKTRVRGLAGKLYKGQCAGTVSEDVAVKEWLKGFEQYEMNNRHIGRTDNL